MLLSAALCLGCSEAIEDTPDGTPDARAISFSASQAWNDDSQAPKATSRAAFTDGDEIGVFACYRTPEGKPATFTTNFMNNQPVYYDGTAWTYSPTKYWPTDGSLEFFGYYPYNKDFDAILKSGITHECITGFEGPFFQAKAEVKAENGTLTGNGISENGNLKLRFRPSLNKVHVTCSVNEGLFDGTGGDEYTDCIFLLLELRFWGIPKKATYSFTTNKWTAEGDYYTQEDPLDMTYAMKRETIEGNEKVPGYKYDPDNGYCMDKPAFIIQEGKKKLEVFKEEMSVSSPPYLYFIPLEGNVKDNDPRFEAVYVVLTKPTNENKYKESGIVTRSGSLCGLFDEKETHEGKGLIEKNININLVFSIDGVTVTRTLVDYNYKPMWGEDEDEDEEKEPAE